MRLSYSKLEAYNICPRMFYLEHVKLLGGGDSFYSQYGSFAHSLIDMANKGMSHDEVMKKFVEDYDSLVTLPHPLGEDRAEDYYLSAYDYFASFSSVIPEALVLASEKKYIVDMFGGEFSGVVDMLVRFPDGSTGIVDHKSTSSKAFGGKSGNKKFRQLYIYSQFPAIRDAFSPQKLIINCFREKKLITRNFDPVALAVTMEWAESTAYEINYMLERYHDIESAWETNKQFYWCEHVCGCSDQCEEMM